MAKVEKNIGGGGVRKRRDSVEGRCYKIYIGTRRKKKMEHESDPLWNKAVMSRRINLKVSEKRKF